MHLIILSWTRNYLQSNKYILMYEAIMWDMLFYLKEKFTPEWPFIFFTPIKSLYKNMLFTKISASNER